MRRRLWGAICLALGGFMLAPPALAQYQETFAARAARAKELAQKPLKVLEIIEAFEDSTDRVSERFAAMGSGEPVPPLSDDEISAWVIQPHIDAVQRLARELPPVTITPISSSGGGAGLPPLDRRRVMRARVLELIQRRDEIDEGRDLVEQYRLMDLALGQLSSSLHSTGEGLMSLFALQTVPAPLPDFVRRVGYLPLDLVSTYPDALLRSQVALQGKSNEGKEKLGIARDRLSAAVAEAQGQLSAERAVLNVLRARLDELRAQADRADQQLGELREQRRLAQASLRQAESELDDAERDVDRRRTALAEAENWHRIVDERVQRDMALAHAAYDMCPDGKQVPWERCSHDLIKSNFMETSAYSPVVQFRSSRTEAGNAREDEARKRAALNDAQSRVQAARLAIPPLRDYLQRWDEALARQTSVQAAAAAALQAERERTRVDLLLDAISHDEAELRAVGALP